MEYVDLTMNYGYDEELLRPLMSSTRTMLKCSQMDGYELNRIIVSAPHLDTQSLGIFIDSMGTSEARVILLAFPRCRLRIYHVPERNIGLVIVWTFMHEWQLHLSGGTSELQYNA